MTFLRRPPRTRFSRRLSFTLVELIVTVAVIGILAGMMLGAVQTVRNQARETRTRSTVARLHRIIMAKYDSFRTRPVTIDLRKYISENAGNGVDYDFNTQPYVQKNYLGDPTTIPKFLARARVNALRDMIRMELPDRWSDVTFQPSNPSTSVPDQASLIRPRYYVPDASKPTSKSLERAKPPKAPTGGQERLQAPAATYYYNQMYTSAYLATSNKVAVADHSSAKCLYLIVSMIPGALKQFTPEEVADVSGDGLKVFVDGWGRPIYFLRWPVGFLPTQPGGISLPAGRVWQPAVTTLQTGDAIRDHDPFDPQRAYEGPMSDPNADAAVLGYGTYPLIYSAGPDGEYDINVGKVSGDAAAATSWYVLDAQGNLNPYALDPNGNLVGQAMNGSMPKGADENSWPARHFDNITNHALEAK